VDVPVVLTGDVHHYARYASDGDGDGDGADAGPRQTLITSGQGGAYLGATHGLPERLDVPRRLAEPSGSRRDTRPYQLWSRWPSREQSSRLARGVWRLPWRNPGLPLLFSLFQTGFVAGIVRDSWSVLVGLIALAVVGSVAFARPRRGGVWAKRAWGLSLAIPQLALSWGIAELCAAIADDWAEPGVIGAVVVTALVAGYVASGLLALWLFVVHRFGVNLNELFAAQSIEDYKGFLRLRIDPDGSLTVYPIGIRRRVRAWQPGGDDHGPRLVPAAGERLDPILVEPPVHLR
jgi:hypothetical protein